MSDQKLFAFFEYFNGSFDTFLCGPIDRFDERGQAFIPSYQMYVKPIAVFPAQIGEKIFEEIEELEREFSNKKKELNDQYSKAIKSLIDDRK